MSVHVVEKDWVRERNMWDRNTGSKSEKLSVNTFPPTVMLSGLKGASGRIDGLTYTLS